MLSFEIDCYTTLLKVFYSKTQAWTTTKLGLVTSDSHPTQDLKVPLLYPMCNTDTLTICFFSERKLEKLRWVFSKTKPSH